MTPRVPGRERPILFSGPMVRAILDGRKTQTRRVVGAKASWDRPAGYRHAEIRMRPDFDAEIYWPEFPDFPPIRVRNRYGKPGDRLWVRETFWDHDFDQGDPTTKLSPERLAERVEYRADEWERKGDGDAGGWKPSIHMPRWASRLTLEITEVRVQRLQDISDADAIAEGADARLLAEGVSRLAEKAKAQRLHWVGGDRSDQVDSFCRRCCEKRVAKLVASGADAFVDGGWGTEEDGSAFCADCGALLDCSLTDYGVDQELEALERDGITTPEDAHIAHTLLNYGGNPLVGEECGGTALRPDLKGRVARLAFRTLWDSLNKPRGYGWDVNPWVWALSFRRVPS